jgi:hypothetical protein
MTHPPTDAADIARTRVEALTTHYQKTHEMALRFWDQRNRLFLILISVLAAAAMLTFAQEMAEKALLNWLQQIGGVDGKEKQSDPLALAQQTADLQMAVQMLSALLLVAVFYLMANLYQHSATISRYYGYLARLEKQIRRELGIADGSAGFSRESAINSKSSARMSRVIGYSFKAILLSLLVAFFALRLTRDCAALKCVPTGVRSLADVVGWGRTNFLFTLDVLVLGLTAIFFWSYARHSRREGDED